MGLLVRLLIVQSTWRDLKTASLFHCGGGDVRELGRERIHELVNQSNRIKALVAMAEWSTARELDACLSLRVSFILNILNSFSFVSFVQYKY